jgi:hypothetical protein
MKKLFFSFFIILLVVQSAKSQTIKTVVSDKFNPQPVQPGVGGLDAANLIVDAINKIGVLVCSNTLNKSLGAKIEETRNKYKDKYPKGVPVEFMCLTDKFKCEVIAIIVKTQIIRIKNNVCSVDDIKVENPGLLYNPDTTGFFNIKIIF